MAAQIKNWDIIILLPEQWEHELYVNWTCTISKDTDSGQTTVNVPPATVDCTQTETKPLTEVRIRYSCKLSPLMYTISTSNRTPLKSNWTFFWRWGFCRQNYNKVTQIKKWASFLIKQRLSEKARIIFCSRKMSYTFLKFQNSSTPIGHTV